MTVMPTQQSGFTLLELLIASIIFAIMALMAYGGLDNVIQNSKSSEQSLKRLQQVQQCIAIMNRDFSQIMPRTIRDEFGNTRPYLSASDTSDYLVEFTRGGRVNPANLLRSSLLRIAYRFDDSTLIRVQWPQLDRAQGIKPRETKLIDKLEEVTFRFLDKNGEWQNQWPPLNAAASTNQELNTNRPSAMEVVLLLDDWGEIRRLYSLN
jgi:general secretion pathway protein J